MSQFAADVLGLTQLELLEFLDLHTPSQPLHIEEVVAVAPEGNEGTGTLSNVSITIISVSLLLLIASFTLCLILYCKNKNGKGIIKKKEKVHPNKKRTLKYRILSLLRRREPLVSAKTQINQDQEEFDEEELNNVKTVDIDIDASFPKSSGSFALKLNKVSNEPLSQVVKDNAYLYVVIKTNTSKDTYKSELSPVSEETYFNETTLIPLQADAIDSTALIISVYASDRFSRRRMTTERTYKIGLANVEKADEAETLETDEIKESKDSIVPLVLSVESVSEGPLIVKKLEFNPEIALSLCYMPTSGRLTLVVLQGKRFCKPQMVPILAYVRVSLVNGNKTMKTMQTGVVKKSANPVFNEVFVFAVPIEKIKDAAIVVTVMIQDQDAKHAISLGKIVIGSQADTVEGRQHWDDMFKSSRKPIAMFHSVK